MIKIGIVGAGHLGKIHLYLLKNIPDFEIAGFFDTDKKAGAEISKETGLRAFSSYEEMEKSCQAIDIVCPTTYHYEYAQKAIKAGKHVFIEKPVTILAEETKKLLKLSQEAGITAQVGHVEQFNPAFLAAKNIIKRPVFISAERHALYNPRGTDVSVVLDLMIHDIDLILKMVKSPVKKIQAYGAQVICQTDDIAQAHIEFNNGCVATVSTSRVALHNRRSLQVFQPDNYLHIDLLNKTLTKAQLSKDKKAGNVIAERDGLVISKETIQVEPINAIEYELKAFAAAIKQQSTPAVTLEDAYLTMQTVGEIMDVIKKAV